jgi:undecaprenyl-diphosphatase
MTRGSNQRPVLVFNPDSGPGLDENDLRARFPDADLQAGPAGRLPDVVTGAVEGGAPYVVAAGGDGTLRAVAEVLAGTKTALLPVPGGTLNHFARAMGLNDIDASVDAARAGVTQAVDVGEVNGHVFLNNASIGAYPRMVARRERHEQRIPRWLAQPLATLQEIRHGRALRLRIDGRDRRVWLVFVGNGEYGGELGGLGDRESMSDNVLDVRVVSAAARWPRARLVLAALAGRLSRSSVVDAWTAREVTITTADSATLRVALDGDITVLEPPLQFRSRAGALLVRYNQPS